MKTIHVVNDMPLARRLCALASFRPLPFTLGEAQCIARENSERERRAMLALRCVDTREAITLRGLTQPSERAPLATSASIASAFDMALATYSENSERRALVLAGKAPAPKVKTGLRPLADCAPRENEAPARIVPRELYRGCAMPRTSAQSAIRAPRVYGETESFRALLVGVCYSAAHKRARRDARAVSQIAELAEVAQGAAAIALARFIARARALGIDAESSLGFLPARGRFPRFVYASAHKAIDGALSKLAKESGAALAEREAARAAKRAGKWARAALLAPREEIKEAARFAANIAERKARAADLARWSEQDSRLFYASAPALALADDDGEDCASVYASRAIRARAAWLRDAIRASASKGNGNARRAARSHLASVDKWEARALALASGEAGAALDCIAIKPSGAPLVLASSASVTDASGRALASDGKGFVSGTRETAHASERRAEVNAGFEQLRRLRAFIGEAPAPASPFARARALCEQAPALGKRARAALDWQAAQAPAPAKQAPAQAPRVYGKPSARALALRSHKPSAKSARKLARKLASAPALRSLALARVLRDARALCEQAPAPAPRALPTEPSASERAALARHGLFASL